MIKEVTCNTNMELADIISDTKAKKQLLVESFYNTYSAFDTGRLIVLREKYEASGTEDNFFSQAKKEAADAVIKERGFVKHEM